MKPLLRQAAAPLIEFAFHVAILTSIGLYLLDAVFPSAVTPFLPLGAVLLVTGCMGVLSAVLPNRNGSADHGSLPHPKRRILATVGLGAVGAVLLWESLRDMGGVAIGLTVLAVAIVVTLFLAIESTPDLSE